MALIYNKVRSAHYSKAEVLTNYPVNRFHLVQDRSVFDNGARESNPSLYVTGVGSIVEQTLLINDIEW